MRLIQKMSIDKSRKKRSDISKVYGNSHYVLATWDKDSTLEIGDKIWVESEELEIAAINHIADKNGIFSDKRDGRTSSDEKAGSR